MVIKKRKLTINIKGRSIRVSKIFRGRTIPFKKNIPQNLIFQQLSGNVKFKTTKTGIRVTPTAKGRKIIMERAK